MKSAFKIIMLWMFYYPTRVFIQIYLFWNMKTLPYRLFIYLKDAAYNQYALLINVF